MLVATEAVKREASFIEYTKVVNVLSGEKRPGRVDPFISFLSMTFGRRDAVLFRAIHDASAGFTNVR